MAIHYYEQSAVASLSQRRRLSIFLTGKIQEYRPCKKITINYIFCNDAFLLQYNKKYLQHDTLTDIITFDLSDRPDHLLADIYISVDSVRENAAALNIPYQEELHRVIFHGVLHLCGFGDKTIADQKVMRAKEQECLHQYGSLK